jgi:hypothetical protein
VKDLYNEYYEVLKKEIVEYTRRWKDLPCSWISRTNIVKISIIPQVIHKFNVITIKIPMDFFMDIEKTLKFI